MVFCMATKKLTITLPVEQLERIKKLVAKGSAKSISAFVQDATRRTLEADDAWGAELAQALAETGGPLTKKERAWADEILFGKKKKRRKAA